MKPNAMIPANQIARAGWAFRSDDDGNTGNDAILAAAAVETVRLLDLINDKLDALGRDGLHQLIREVLSETRAKRRTRLKKQRRAKAVTP